MGTVRINFLGVCTIFRDLPSLLPPDLQPPLDLPPNRVVLARTTDCFMRVTGVDPHIAKLQFVADQIIIDGPPLPPTDPPQENTYSLNGVGLKIKNATQTELSSVCGLDCLPSLAAYLDGKLPPPASYVFLPDGANVQAWFDVQGGDAKAYKMRTIPSCDLVPSITILTMETDGDPQLEYQPWDGSATTVTLARAAEPPDVNVMNFAFGKAFVDDDDDFLLNYWLAETFPKITKIAIPHANVCKEKSPKPGFHVGGCGDAGPGCSNTTYP